MASQRGLAWEEDLFCPRPVWTIEPDIAVVEQVARRALDEPHPCKIEFFTQGAFNKLYKIHCSKGAFIMRVSLPVDPRFKTLSEVATLAFVRRHTDLPVANIVAYDCSNDNEIGFEWILMELMPGVPLADRWRTMSWSAKERLVRRFAVGSAQLFRRQFNRIGNPFLAEAFPQQSEDWVPLAEDDAASTEFLLGRIVSMQFFFERRFTDDVPRGPFKSSIEWLLARLQFAANDSERIQEAPGSDEEDREGAEATLTVIRRLQRALPKIFSDESDRDDKTPTALLHSDLSFHNIPVDDDGELQAVVDWENVSVLSLWKAAEVPTFFQGPERRQKPATERYATNFDTGEITELYWGHVQDHEHTLLREFFVAEMRRIEPAWFDVYENSTQAVDTDQAIEQCDLGRHWRQCIHSWLDEVEKGEASQSLRERFSGPFIPQSSTNSQLSL